ncbi:MAG: hypothetical protein DRH08_03780 [Deltaproteobacteria bacterium]|nr:MAG: hypothetical protein DRH08_03780 [Deltaproteobacteria bacterium]
MVILTAATSASAGKGYEGRIYKNFSFKNVIQRTIIKAEELGYKAVVYDLNNLGIGEHYEIKDDYYLTNGYHQNEVKPGYKSRSLFKAEIVKKCMNDHNDLIVYLDGDAQLCGDLNEIETDDYDIGVTLRDKIELSYLWHKKYFDVAGYVNAGVIFFNNTPACNNFVEEWRRKTQSLGNDQMALNYLVCPSNYPEKYSVTEKNGVRIKFFPVSKFNYYSFNYRYFGNAKILHFKSSVRNFYPFDWRKRCYCFLFINFRSLLIGTLRKYVFSFLWKM